MNETNITYGLLLRRYMQHGYECLSASIVKREGNLLRNASDFMSDYERPKYLQGIQLDGFVMDGFIQSPSSHNTYPRTFIGYEPQFKNVSTINQRTVERMAKTFKKVNAKIDANAAHTAVDVFTSLCSALKLSFVVENASEYESSSYDNNKWRWMSLGEGRNRYRSLIEDMEEAANKELAS